MNLRLVKKYHYIFIIIIFTLNVIVLGWIYFGLNFEAKETYKNHLKGDWIAFSCSPAGDANLSSIFLIRPDGSNLQQITPNNAVASMPNWSPDGYWIAFVSNGSLFKIHPDGSDFQSILYDNNNFPDENRNTLPEWSPDGKYIAFIAYKVTTFTWDIYRINGNGNDLKRLTFNINAQRSVDWSPDGKWITFASSMENGRTGIYKMQANGEDLQLLTDPNQSADDHAWSPDGNKIVFSTQMSNNINLAVMQVDGQHIEQITKINGAATYPEWSPDGEWIVFSMATSANSIYQLYKIRLDGTEFTKITNSNCNAVAPSWFSFSQ